MDEPNTFAECAAMAATRRRKLANNTYLEVNPDGTYGIRLHSTQVVVFHPDGRIVLDSGTWHTVTTKERMNRFSTLSIYSERGVWFVSVRGSWDNVTHEWTEAGPTVPYADGITFHADGRIEGEGDDPKAQQKERKAAAKFAKEYVEALAAGEISAPSSGDCWGCLMKATDGTRPMGGRGHMLEHMSEAERYFVPSIAFNAAERFGVSMAARQWLASRWAGSAVPNPGEFFGGIASDQIRKAIRRWVLGELGHAV